MENTLGYIRQESKVEKLVRSKLFWLLFVLIGFSYPIYRSINRELPPELPRLHPAPQFQFTNEFGKPFGSNDLKGKTYLATFAFTSCPTTCPGLMEKVKVIQKRVKGVGQKIAILTFTVDPDFDTPKVLYKYARRLKANPFVWSFLTGKKEDLHKTLVDGFKVPMGDKEEVSGKLEGEDVTMLDIAHSEKVVLVDSEGMVRGYYSTDKTNMDRLMIDIGLLMNRSY